MTSAFSKQRHIRSSWAMVGIVLASFLVHGIVVATTTFHLGKEGAKKESEILSTLLSFRYSCWSDASLSFSARSVYCAMEGQAKDHCLLRVWKEFRDDLLLCDGLEDTSDIELNSVAYMSAEEVAKIQTESILDVPAMDEIVVAKLLDKQIAEKEKEALEQISNPKEVGQVVEIVEPEVEQIPDNARFLSEHNTAVEKESVARGRAKVMVKTPAEDQVASVETVEKKTQVEKTGVSQRSSLLAMRAQDNRQELIAGEKRGELSSSSLGALREGQGNIEQSARRAQNHQEERSGSIGSSAGSGGLLNLRPTAESISKVIGGGSVDKLDGVESGDSTLLNSKKWKFAGFFNRMKRQVAQVWDPGIVYRQRDPRGKVYGDKSRETVLKVSLSPEGRLENVVVTQSSGIRFLDEEAISAFQQAHPFPNPPVGIVDSSSKLITFSFGFYFSVGQHRSSWKIFRKR